MTTRDAADLTSLRRLWLHCQSAERGRPGNGRIDGADSDATNLGRQLVEARQGVKVLAC